MKKLFVVLVAAVLAFTGSAHAVDFTTSAGVGLVWTDVEATAVTTLTHEDARPSYFVQGDLGVVRDVVGLQTRLSVTDFDVDNVYTGSVSLRVSYPLSLFTPYGGAGFGVQNNGFVTTDAETFAVGFGGLAFDVRRVGVFVEARVSSLTENLGNGAVDTVTGGVMVGLRVKQF